MGSLANSLFQFFLGWIRILFSSLWESVTTPSRSSLLGWIGDHWLVLLIGVCVVGTVTDLVVYLFRWRPFRVWASFLRRIRKRREERKTAQPETEVLSEEAYEASDVSEVSFRQTLIRDENEEIMLPEAEEEPKAWTWEEPESGRKNPAVTEKEPGVQTAYAMGERLPEAGENPGVTARFEQAIRPRRRRARMKDLFNEEGTEPEYTAPQELIDRREAYHSPVYPRSWKGNNNTES